jgi:hypothetical protein
MEYPTCAESEAPYEDGKSSDDPAAQVVLPNSLTHQHQAPSLSPTPCELENSNFQYAPHDFVHSMGLDANAQHQLQQSMDQFYGRRLLQKVSSSPAPGESAASRLAAAFQACLSEEELRIRSIAAFRSVLEEIQLLLYAESGAHLMNLINQHEHNNQHAANITHGVPVVVNETCPETSPIPLRWDLVRLILPAIEKCTLHSANGGLEESVPDHHFYGVMNGSPVDSSGAPTSVMYHHQESTSSSTGESRNKRQRVLPMAAFQSQLEDTHHVYGGSLDFAGGSIDHTSGAASALEAAQVLYHQSASAAASHHCTHPHPFVASTSHAVFGAMSTPVAAHHRAPISLSHLMHEEDFSQTAGAVRCGGGATNDAPALVTTKIHHPRSVFYTQPPTQHFKQGLGIPSSPSSTYGGRTGPLSGPRSLI